MPFQQPAQARRIAYIHRFHIVAGSQLFRGRPIHQEVEIEGLQGMQLRHLQQQQPHAQPGQAIRAGLPAPPPGQGGGKPMQSHRRQQAERDIQEIKMFPIVVLIGTQQGNG